MLGVVLAGHYYGQRAACLGQVAGAVQVVVVVLDYGFGEGEVGG